MKSEQESRIRRYLNSEIGVLESRYSTISNYLDGAEMEDFEVASALKAYRDDLAAISAHILTLYVVTGKKTKITWDSLLDNIDTALNIITNSVNPNSRAAIGAALNMSEPRIQEVMNYLAMLKKSL